MQRPSVLSRRNPHLNKKDFGHVLVVAGSASMLGAAALCSLAAMRSGTGLVTVAVPRSLNLTLHKKLSSVIMTLPLPETKAEVVSFRAYDVIKDLFPRFNAIAIGPGLGLHPATQKLVRKIVKDYPGPMVVDADALNVLALDLKPLIKARGPRILTPHAGEMARLTGRGVPDQGSARAKLAKEFSRRYHCILVLKGHRTMTASSEGRVVINQTGNVGMATAGSGDVLSGMISAFLAQGIQPFEAACWAVRLHGAAGDWAAKKYTKVSMTAQDIIEGISAVITKR